MWSTSAGTGVPVVMIHGAFCDFRYFEPQQIAFARNRRAIAVSLPGYYPDHDDGSASRLSAEQHIQDVGAFVAELGAAAHVIGHSRGGRIALHVAARFPELVKTLVLIEPGGILSPDFLPRADDRTARPAPTTDVRPAASALIKRDEVDAGLRLYVDSGHGTSAWDRAPALFKRVAVANARTIDAMIADNTGAISAAAARQVQAPTLLLAGTNSPPIFHKIIDVLAGTIPTNRRATIADAAHFLTLTHPAEVNAAIEKFWSDQSA
jgi:pimeloyl-ACP methyl ester carboxylesterase